MKRPPVLVLWFVLSLFSFDSLNAQSSEEYYVVVGAFTNEINAKKFGGFVKKKFYQSTYEYNSSRKLFYVYTQKFSNKPDAVRLVRTLQQQPEFFDSWVYTKQLPLENQPVVKTEQTKDKTQSEISQAETLRPEINSDSGSMEVKNTQTPAETAPKKRVVKGKLFKFDIRTPDGAPLIGKVHYVNQKLGKDLATYSSEDYSDVVLPLGSDKNMTIVCGIFGYKEITKEVDYTAPDKLEGVTRDTENAWVIPFQLERLKSGDESIMYEVSFFKNSVAMQEKSKVDLKELLNMMQSNPTQRIRINGHANGKDKRLITYLGKTKNYFSQEGTAKKQATALELSTLRSKAVRDYLVDGGIDVIRMEVKGFGNKAMIVPENHPASSLNDRIEIQILRD